MENKRYSLDSEKKWQDFWVEKKINKFDQNTKNNIYSIDTPPPTVSWKIHIWHIFSYTQAEVIARYKNMSWNTLFYPFGFDDNWLPTERLVEKDHKIKWSELPREEFSKKCLSITDEYRNKFKWLWQSMGFSVDWDLSYSTISPSVQKASQTSFLNLIEKWAIYQSNAPVLWCPECRTALAQADVEKKEFDSVFYDIEFNLVDGSPLIISTTRPELLPACTAVFINSKDKRYLDILWKEVITPLWQKVKILADDKVDLDKWTWVVMCCTYWDETDMYWVKKYWLEEKIILDKWWMTLNTWDSDLDWIYYKKARKIIINKLEEINKVVSKKNITHDVWTHERCSTPIEILPVKQWFIKVVDIKDKLIDQWNKINWYPAFMKKRYVNWVENLKWDWCISRERFFWVPIPVWYSKITWEIILPNKEDLPINPLNSFPKNLPEWHTNNDIIPEKDVLDTWATSSLTPLINAKFFEENNLNDKILPMDLRPQAHDIIRTWALYTIIMSYYHTWEIPFKNIMISGHVLAPKWEKISKSKNNAWATPEKLIEKYWSDSVRYWACWWNLWRDIAFDELEIKKGQKLVTKLWNALKYANLNLWDFEYDKDFDINNLQIVDKWIIEKSMDVWNNMSKYFDKFEVWHALIEFESFFWSDYCDNYLEIVKDKITNFEWYDNWEELKKSSQYWLYIVSLNILKLISPILPHISEELYQKYFIEVEKEISIHKKSYIVWIEEENQKNYISTNKEISKLFKLVNAIRKFKTDNSIKYWVVSEKVNISSCSDDIKIYNKYINDIKSISRVLGVNFIESDDLVIDIINSNS